MMPDLLGETELGQCMWSPRLSSQKGVFGNNWMHLEQCSRRKEPLLSQWDFIVTTVRREQESTVNHVTMRGF